MQDESYEVELEAELRRLAARIDPVPAELIEQAGQYLTWRTIDADLAELVFDSYTDADTGVLVRGAGQARSLTFQAEGVSIEVEVSRHGGTVEMVGQLVPPQPASLELRHGARVSPVEVDELGRFAAPDVPPGPVSLCCRLAGSDATIVTDWLTLYR